MLGYKNWRQSLLVGLFFSVIALSLLAPLSSNDIMPESADFAAHTALIVQAKMALLEGQFPLRVAPWQYSGWRYPVFQFYASFSHTAAALIYMYITPDNPYLALKITIWLALLLSGIYIYRLVSRLTSSNINGLLSGMLYMAAPYYIINNTVRGDLSESIAEGLIPMVLFYTFQLVKTQNLRNFCLLAFSCSILALNHTITFAYTSLYIGILLIFMIFIRDMNFSVRKLFVLGVAYVYSISLVMWFIAPIMLFEKYLQIDWSFKSVDLMRFSWLTSIASLISVNAVAPAPLPAFGFDFPFFLDPAIGWPTLLAVGVCLYVYISKTTIPTATDINKLYLILLFLFFLAFFMVWTPFDFWSYLPKHIAIAQFSYRLLSQMVWIGTLLFAFALAWLFGDKMDKRHLIIGILLIGISSGTWLHSNTSNKLSISSLIQNPDMNYGKYDYLVKPIVYTQQFSQPQIVQAVNQVQNSCRSVGASIACSVSVTQAGFVQLPILYYPEFLNIKVNGQRVQYTPLVADNNYVTTDMQGRALLLAGIELGPGTYDISSEFVGLWWANWVSRIAWFGLISLFVFSLFKPGKLLLLPRRSEFTTKQICKGKYK